MLDSTAKRLSTMIDDTAQSAREKRRDRGNSREMHGADALESAPMQRIDAATSTARSIVEDRDLDARC